MFLTMKAIAKEKHFLGLQGHPFHLLTIYMVSPTAGLQGSYTALPTVPAYLSAELALLLCTLTMAGNHHALCFMLSSLAVSPKPPS